MTSTDTISFKQDFDLHPDRQDRPAALLIQLQSQTLARVSDLVKAFLGIADGAFLKQAENARSNNEQASWLDAMRELRRHSRRIDLQLRDLLAADFDRLQQGLPAPVQKPAPCNGELSLLAKERVELDVALGNLRTKLRATCADQLLHLSLRLNEYLGIDWLNEGNLPLGSERFIAHVAEVTRCLDLPLNSRLHLYKHFERHVVEQLRPLLEDANQLLCDAGILPRIPRSSTRSSKASPGDSPSVPPELPLDQAAAFTTPFPALQVIMSEHYGNSLNHRLFTAPRGQSGREMDRPALLAVLDRLQAAQAHTAQESDSDSPVDHLDMRLLLEHQIAHAARENGARKLRQSDDDTINLVSMVFEFMLDDRNLAPEMALLLGRLQIPVIKVALRNKEFFSNANHPARRLLKLLSQAAMGWEREPDPQRDQLYHEMQQITQHILNGFNGNNLELFETLEQQFEQFLIEECRRADLLEKRILQTLEGQTKTEHARRLIGQLINDRLQGKTLSAVVIDMIEGPWRVLMLQVLLRDGRESASWQDCLHTLDDLIWSVQPALAAANRDRWIKLIPQLLKRLRSNLEAINHPGLEVNKFLESLWEIHGQILQNPPNQPLPDSRKVDHTLDDPGNNLHQKKTRQRSEHNPTPASADLRHLVESMPCGQWVEICREQSKPRRGKLVYRCNETDHYIFVNRRGQKALETDLANLLHLLQNGELRLLQNGSFWDRAISAVMSRLTGNGKAIAATTKQQE